MATSFPLLTSSCQRGEIDPWLHTHESSTNSPRQFAYGPVGVIHSGLESQCTSDHPKSLPLQLFGGQECLLNTEGPEI